VVLDVHKTIGDGALVNGAETMEKVCDVPHEPLWQMLSGLDIKQSALLPEDRRGYYIFGRYK
jgi:hypothetical protein